MLEKSDNSSFRILKDTMSFYKNSILYCISIKKNYYFCNLNSETKKKETHILSVLQGLKTIMTMKHRILIIIPLFAILIYTLAGSCVDSHELHQIYKNTSLTDLAREGDRLLKAHNPDSALIYYSLVTAKLDDKAPDSLKTACARSLASQGYIYLFYKNDYAMSYASYLKALDLLDNMNDSTLYPEIYLNLGNIYFDYKEEDKMLDFYRKAFMSSVNVKDWKTLRITLTSILALMITDKKTDKFSEEIKIFDSLQLPDTKEFRSLALHREAVRALSVSDYDTAISLISKAKAESDLGLIQNRYGVLCDMQTADLLSHQGKYDEAISVTRGILRQNDNEMDIQRATLKALSNLYSHKNEADSMLKYLRLSTAMSDSIFKSQQYGLIRDIGLNHDINKLDSKIKIIETERNATRRALAISCGALIIIISLAVVVFFQNKKLRERNIDLFKHNSQAMEREAKERALRSNYEKQIEELTAITEYLRETKHEENTEKPKELQVTEEEKSEASGRKYQNSHLSDVMEAKLLSKIDEVMSDETEILSNSFSLDRLASLVASNTSYVSQIINKTYSKSFQNLLGEARVKLACHRLCDKEYDHLTMEAIALDLGFKSRTNFISVFKKATGLTPSEYRKINKQTSQTQ